MNNTKDANSTAGMIDRIVNSSLFLFEPWFMGIAVSALIVIIVITFLYTMLCPKSQRRESQEAILNFDEEKSTNIRQPKRNRTPCVIVATCMVLIAVLVLISVVVYEIRFRNETVQEFSARTWSNMYAVVKQPWFVGGIFGVLLLLVILFSIRSILEENKKANNKSRNTKKACSGAFSEPWFIAFSFALGLIIILSLALFRLSCQKEGEAFMDTFSRFFILEPWFFGIVVGVILLTLVIFNIYRILRGKGENYSVEDGNQANAKELVIESQGFDEYPSKSTVSQNIIGQQQENSTDMPSNSVNPPLSSNIIQEQTNQMTVQPTATHHNNVIQPSLSLQMNEGNFYDEKQFHDEDDSMAEYGLGENDQFNDEGSFIGLYNRDRIQNYMAQFNKNNLS